jgi:L-ascorbate metabolism protein UlaG (beta-lactamase superfamily)
MKKVIFLILGIVFMTISCTKEETTNLTPVDVVVPTENLKCASNGKDDRNNKFKWKLVNEMVKNMHWIQQSCFRIETPKCKIYTDPLSITQTDVANLILVTHAHGDHFSPDDINKLTGPNTVIIAPAECNYTGSAKRIILKPGEEYNAGRGVKIKALYAYNITKTDFHPKSNNWVGYLITINGVTIYHAGDTERIPEMKDIRCDIALLPLGQTYTMNSVADAAESAKDVHAMVAIPMHYGMWEGTETDAQTFKDLLEGFVKVVIKTKGE